MRPNLETLRSQGRCLVKCRFDPQGSGSMLLAPYQHRRPRADRDRLRPQGNFDQLGIAHILRTVEYRHHLRQDLDERVILKAVCFAKRSHLRKACQQTGFRPSGFVDLAQNARLRGH